MRKIIKSWGNSLVIVFNSEDVKSYELSEGDVLDMELTKVKEKKKHG